MIESYSLLAALTVQILVVSVLLPIRIFSRMRAQAAKIPTEQLAQWGVEFHLSQERSLTQFRVLNTGAVVLGLLLLWWLSNLMTQRPDWGDLELLVLLCFMVQILPIALVDSRHREMLRLFMPEKRKAVLRRRGLFDVVSPLPILLAVLAYLLFAAYVIYLLQHPFPGFRGLSHLVGPTLVCALYAVIIYKKLHGRIEPLETHEDRLHRIGGIVRFFLYFFIAFLVHKALKITLVMLELQRWEPFALSVLLVVSVLGAIRLELPRQPNADDAFAGAINGQTPAKVRSS